MQYTNILYIYFTLVHYAALTHEFSFAQAKKDAKLSHCGLQIGNRIFDDTSHRRLVNSNLSQSCENSHELTIIIPHLQVKKSFSKVSTISRLDKLTEDQSSPYSSWMGEDSSDGSSFNFVHDQEGNMAGSIVDMTSNNVIQIHSRNGQTVATITASKDFPPEGEPSERRNRKLIETNTNGSLNGVPIILSSRNHDIKNEIHLNAQDASKKRKLYDDNGGNLDIMVIWTAKAECLAYGLSQGCTLTDESKTNMVSLITLAVSETNEAYRASGVNTELLLVHAYRHPNYVETTFDKALDDMDFGNMSGVHSDRETYGADLVALIMDGPDYCGLAFMGPDKESMWSATSWICATGYYTFGHEVGHNLGLNHDRGTEDTCGNDGDYNYGYRDPNANYRTTMAYDCEANECDNNVGGGCNRIQRYSTPNLTYNGLPIGAASIDNVRAINDVIVEVAGYYPHANTISAAPSPAPCMEDEIDVEISVKTDSYPEENSWEIMTSDGNLIDSDPLNFSSDSQMCLSSSLCYTFNFTDTYGDGLEDPGHFTLTVNGVILLQDTDEEFTTLGVDFGLCDGSTLAPTSATTEEPTASPTFNTCADSPFRFRLRKNGRNISRSCEWVANKDTMNRCALGGVSSMCPSTCDACECADGESRFRFLWNGRMITRDCGWVGNKQTIQRCQVAGMTETCRSTCNSC